MCTKRQVRGSKCSLKGFWRKKILILCSGMHMEKAMARFKKKMIF
uniref:Uncharacterized protein n=1 Tax=Anguilla anguilla TaxID=7936 RepID=A0A0E9T1Y1_ANGAN